jgi:hypothetical protein
LAIRVDVVCRSQCWRQAAHESANYREYCDGQPERHSRKSVLPYQGIKNQLLKSLLCKIVSELRSRILALSTASLGEQRFLNFKVKQQGYRRAAKLDCADAQGKLG